MRDFYKYNPPLVNLDFDSDSNFDIVSDAISKSPKIKVKIKLIQIQKAEV